MYHNTRLTALVLALLVFGTSALAASLPPPAGYSRTQLIFEDRFLSTSLNTTHWNPWMGDDTYGRWGDQGNLPSPYSSITNCPGDSCSGEYELDYADPYPYGFSTNTAGRHLVGGNGNLALIATPSSAAGYLGYSWASATISSYGHVYLPATGGYVQWHAKMPDSRYGAWAALWMLSARGAEIDMQESGFPCCNGAPVNNVLAMNWHGGGSQKLVNAGVDLSASYHTYGLEYRPGRSIKMYLDGRLMMTYAESLPTNAKYEILIDQAIAGPAASGWHTVADPTNHPGPFEFDVDDVQIYSLRLAALITPARFCIPPLVRQSHRAFP
jgi:hypothetical protein